MNGNTALKNIHKIKDIINTFGINNVIMALMHIVGKNNNYYDYLTPVYDRCNKDSEVLNMDNLNMLTKELNSIIDEYTLAGLLIFLIGAMQLKPFNKVEWEV